MKTRSAAAIATCALLASCADAARDGRVAPRTNIITGSTGSTWYTIGSALAEKANLAFNGHPITAVPGAGGVSNPVRVSMTGMDLGISYGPFLTAAYRGEPPFREAQPKLRMVASLVLNTLHVLAERDLQLETVEDLVSLERTIRLGSGPPGSGELFCLTAILDVKHVTLDRWQQRGHALRLSGTGQRFDDWKDERLDAVFTFVNDPSPQLTELMVTRPARFLSVPAGLRKTMAERWGFVDLTVAPGSYPNQDYTVETVALPSLLFTVDAVDESIVYAVTKALYEHQDYLRKVHPGFERWDPADLPDEVPVPLHPGAERFYRARGLLPQDAGSDAQPF
ncbi:MAG: TAXI family TRAP transporter solute-binding subunit [Vicinamibacterales bacterium]